MEMLVIGVVALAAFAAVLLPLFRRRPGTGDESEFENIPPAASKVARGTGAPETGAGVGSGGPEPTAGTTGGAVSRAQGDDEIEAEVRRYREAVRAGTVCRKCGQANPPDSAYCFECGARLPLADAKEFE